MVDDNKFIMDFEFDLSGVKYCIMAERAKQFSKCDIDMDSILSPEQRFILK